MSWHFQQFPFFHLPLFRANFTFSPREERQKFLLNDFQFKCSCEACTADFPLMENLKKVDKNFHSPSNYVASVEEAKEIFKQNCEYVEEKIKSFPFPCYEICIVMQNSFRQMQFLAGKSFVLENLEECETRKHTPKSVLKN